MQLLNVALFSQRLGPGGGTAGVALTLAEGLARRGHRVRVFCQRARATPVGAEMLPWSTPHRVARRPGELRIALDRVAACDVVRASGGVHRQWRRASRVGLWRWARSFAPSEVLEERAEGRALRDARLVVCNSEMVAAAVSDVHGLPSQRVRVVRNGVDLDRFRPDGGLRARARERWRIPPGGRVAVFVARGWFRKGFAAAVGALALAGGTRDRLVVIGDDAQADRWLRRARRALGDRLIAMGPGDPARWLPGADVLVHPTRYDASANVVLESLACGVPPITTSCDGAAEIVPDRGLVLADPDDVQGIAAAVRYAWDQPGMGTLCRSVAEEWPASRMVQSFEAALAELDHGGA